MWRFVASLFESSPGRTVEVGTTSDLSLHLSRLKEASAGAFLIVEVPDAEDAFLQFTAGAEVIQMDHPLVTAAQASREQAFRTTCAAIRRSVHDTAGSDGARFLDCDLPADPAVAAADVSRVLAALFGVRPTTELRFVGEGLRGGWKATGNLLIS